MTSPSSDRPTPIHATVIEATVVDDEADRAAVEVEVEAEVEADDSASPAPASRDVSPAGRSGSGQSPAGRSSAAREDSGSGLMVRQGPENFGAFLAPLKREVFKEVVTDVEAKLKIVNQTLSMLDVITDEQKGFDAILEEMLESISFKTAELLSADRTTIYLLDEEKGELWSKIAKGVPELRFPADKGIAGHVATFREAVNIPYDFYDDPRSATAKETDRRTGYRTYSMLVLPLVNDKTEELVSVVQLINKLKPDADPEAPLEAKIDYQGFTAEDEEIFRDFAPSISLILESSKSFYVATQRQRAAAALMKATEALSKSSLDLEATLANVMDQAKELMQADRSTLWLVDEVKSELWTKIPIQGNLIELRIPLNGSSFAAQVAQSGQPLLIPFDLYDHPDSGTSKETDQKTGYRTCSMLCMPVYNADGKLIGVTQLVNKKKQGEYPVYDSKDWPEAPERWRASFNNSDREFMEAFNIQAGVALQNAKLFAEVKQQEQMQKDILRSLSDGVISTDRNGKIVAANESAQELLGLGDTVVLEGRNISDVVRIKDKEESQADNRFAQWLKAALSATEDKARQQYYPDQTLVASPQLRRAAPEEGDASEEHSVNLSVNTIADASDPTQVRGALVVMEDISDEKRLKSTMYRYMTQELAEQLLASGETKMGGDRKEVSVLFSDIRSYTSLTERMTAEEVVAMLNEYFESMVDAVFQHKGTLDKYIGDAIMAVFGSPLPLTDHGWMAVQTAIDMRHRLMEFNHHRQEVGKEPIRIGIGLHSDEVISGNIGSSRRMEFTAIGDGVNLGSRLEGATKQYGCDILISENTYHECGPERIWARELDFIKVKGKSKPVSVFELVGIREGELSRPVSDRKFELMERYRKGRDHFLKREFAQALGAFGSVLELDPTDKAAQLHLERSNQYLLHPPPEDWDGAWTMQSK